METGLCTLFQAFHDGQPVSSMLVAQAVRGAYLQSSGTSPAGMDTGASHFLLYEILSRLQLDGVDVFNLGGVDNIDSGLALFKSHFGATPILLESAEFYLGGYIRRKLTTAARLWAEHPSRLTEILTGKVNRWLVYSTNTAKSEPPILPDGVDFRKLSDDELKTVPPTAELRQEQVDRFGRLGANGAYGSVLQRQVSPHLVAHDPGRGTEGMPGVGELARRRG